MLKCGMDVSSPLETHAGGRSGFDDYILQLQVHASANRLHGISRRINALFEIIEGRRMIRVTDLKSELEDGEFVVIIDTERRKLYWGNIRKDTVQVDPYYSDIGRYTAMAEGSYQVVLIDRIVLKTSPLTGIEIVQQMLDKRYKIFK